MSQASLEDFAAANPEYAFMSDAFSGGGGRGAALGGRNPDIEPSLESYLVDPTVQLIYTAINAQPLRSDLEFIGSMIIGGWKVDVVPVDDDSKPAEPYMQRAKSVVKRGIEAMVSQEGRNKVDDVLMSAWINSLAFNYGIGEWTLGSMIDPVTDEPLGFYGPDKFRVLASFSFSEEPAGRTEGEEWQVDPLLKGVWYNQKEDRYEFYQKPEENAMPILINPSKSKTQGVFIIKDSVGGGRSLMSANLPDFLSYILASRRFQQAIHRNAGGLMFAKIDASEFSGIGDNPFLKSLNQKYVNELEARSKVLLRGWGVMSGGILLPGQKLETPVTSFAMDPMEAQRACLHTLLQTLIPRHIVDTNDGSLTSTGFPILKLLGYVAKNRRPKIVRPVEIVLTRLLLRANGFNDLKVVFTFESLEPEDFALKFQTAIEAYVEKIIPRSRALKYLGYDALSPAEKAELDEEISKKMAGDEGL